MSQGSKKGKKCKEIGLVTDATLLVYFLFLLSFLTHRFPPTALPSCIQPVRFAIPSFSPLNSLISSLLTLISSSMLMISKSLPSSLVLLPELQMGISTCLFNMAPVQLAPQLDIYF